MKTDAAISEGLIRDIVEWDVKNWWRAVEYWEKTGRFGNTDGKKVLDIGGRSGGLSLYWALKGAEVVCSDINEDGFEKARLLHRKYGVQNRIRYRRIDATDIPYQDEFDIICFKSVLGGVGYDNNYGKQETMMENIYRALNGKGSLCFCENLAASFVHRFARKKFTGWGGRWRYITVDEVKELTKEFRSERHETFGFLGVFGRTGLLPEVFGTLDERIDRYVKAENRYIVSCVCRKG